jgi:hypothetical protein
METLLGVRHITRHGDYMFSFDVQDGFYALGIASKVSRLLYGKRSRITLSPSHITDGVVTLTFPLLSPHGDLRSPPSDNGPSELPPFASLRDTSSRESDGKERGRTSTTFSSSPPPSKKHSKSSSASISSSTDSDYFSTQPRDSGTQHSLGTTWASISTQHSVISSPPRTS